jgi:hypothetical protein
MLAQGLELAGITLTIAGIVEALKSTIETFAEFQRASEVLTAITGDATAAGEAMDRIPAIADQLGQSITNLEAAQQRFASFGVALDQIPGMLQTVSDAAVASGRDFDTTAQSFERMISTGQLMTRGLTQAGITVNQLADAMGMSGATSAELTTAFTDLGTGAEATAARVQILEAATSSIAGISQKTADDAMGSWNQLENAVHEAAVSIGESLAVLGGASSLEPLKLLVQAIDTLLVGTITIVTEVKDALTSVIIALIDSLTAVGQAMLDVAHGDFAKAWQDLSAGGQQAWNDLKAGGQKMTDDLSANAKILDGVWGSTTDDLTNESNKAASGMNALALVAANQKSQFDQVAAAYAAGHTTLSQYTTALTALNKAQVDANNGLQVAATVLLLAENAYRTMSVNAANALTNVNQIAAAVDAGQASWTQYVTALNALNKAQMEVSGGLQSLSTVVALVGVAFEQVNVNAKNAQTNFEAVSAAFNSGDATAQQYTAALNALNKAQLELNDGIQQFHTAVLLAEDDQAKLAVAAQNALTALQAQYAVYQQTGEGLTQLITLTNQYVKAQEAASNGAISWASANLQVSAAESQAELNLANANTLLAQAKQLYDDGAISIGTYNKYVQQAQQAQTALEGSTKSNAAASQAAASAHNSLSTAMNGVTASFKVATGAILSQQDALQQVADNYRQLQINLQNAQTWLAAVQQAYDNNQASGSMLVAALQNLIKAQDALGGATGTTTAAMASQINQLENLAGQSDDTATAITGIGTAATDAAGSVASACSSMIDSINSVQADAFQATQALDQFFNQGGMQGGSGTVQVNPGDVVHTPSGGIAVSSDIGITYEDITVDPLGLHQQQLQEMAQNIAAVQANTSAATTSTAATKAATVATAASTDATTNATAATTDLTSTMAGVGAAVTSAANAVSAATGAISPLVTAAGAVVATAAAVVAGSAGPAGSNTTSQITLGPGVTATPVTSGGAGSNTLVTALPSAFNPTAGQGVTVNVNVNGNTIMGAGGAQQLANTIMNTAIGQLRTVAGLKIGT